MSFAAFVFIQGSDLSQKRRVGLNDPPGWSDLKNWAKVRNIEQYDIIQQLLLNYQSIRCPLSATREINLCAIWNV